MADGIASNRPRETHAAAVADATSAARAYDTSYSARHRPVLVVAGMVLEADAVRGRDGIDVRVAMGPAARDLDSRLAHVASHAVGLVSFGTAGALDPALRPGDCLVANAVVGPSGKQWPTDTRWRAALMSILQQGQAPGARLHERPIAGADSAVSTAEEKAALFAKTGAGAVDMESHALAALAAAHDIPFLVCRVVLDQADHSLPAAALAGLTADGRTVVLPVIAALLAKPTQLGSLLRLARDAGTAQRTLKHIGVSIPTHFGLPEADRLRQTVPSPLSR